MNHAVFFCLSGACLLHGGQPWSLGELTSGQKSVGRLIRVSPLPALWSLDNLVINKQNTKSHCRFFFRLNPKSTATCLHRHHQAKTGRSSRLAVSTLRKHASNSRYRVRDFLGMALVHGSGGACGYCRGRNILAISDQHLVARARRPPR